MSEHQHLLALRLLGTPLILSHGAAVPLANQKARALLFYLAAQRQPFTRDYLAALLWSDASVASARHSLRSALYKLRQALSGSGPTDALVVSDETITLDWSAVWCDLAAYRELLAAGDEASLRAAVDLVRGPFLQGFGLPDSLLFDEFVQHQDAQLASGRHQALRLLAACAEARQDWPQAIADLERLVQLDPLDEQAHQRLLALYVRVGSPGLAQRHFKIVERTLDQELGIAPAAETRAVLRNAVAQRAPAVAVAAPITFVRPKPSALPFSGHERALSLLRQSAAQAAEGEGQCVILVGAAGIGKSRSVDELLASLQQEAKGRAWQIFQGRCSPYDSFLTFGPFREAFGALLPDSTDLASPTLIGLPPQPTQFVEHVLRTVTALCWRGPVALAIDDLHLANENSLALFGYLAMQLRRLPLLLIGTAESLDEPSALRQLCALGRRRGDVQCVTLEPLALDAVDRLLASVGVSPTAARSLAPWLHARSGGNPFVIEALLVQLRSEQVLTRHSTGWNLDGASWMAWRDSTLLPTSTYDLVITRVEALSSPARQLLGLLAVAGGTLRADLIGPLLELSPTESSAAIDELLGLHMLFEQRDTLALRHELLRDAALSSMSARTRVGLHRRLVVGLETQGAPIEELARHAVAGGDLPRAQRYGLELLRDFPYAYAGGETIAFLMRLAELIGPSATPEEAYRLAQCLGQAHHSLGQLAEARCWYEQQLHLAQRHAWTEAEVTARYLLAELALVYNDYRAAIDEAGRGLSAAERLPVTRWPSLVGRGRRLLGAAQAMEGGNLNAAEAHLRAAIAAHRHTGERIELSAGLFELGNVLAQQGQILAAVEHYRQARAQLSAGEAPFLQALAENNLAYHALLLGRPEETATALARGQALAERHSLSSVLLHLYSTETELQLYRGRWADAEAASCHGLALAERLGNYERQAGYRASLALAAAGQGRYHEAREQLERALGMLVGSTYWHLRTRILLWLADLALDHAPADVDAYLETAVTLARVQGRELMLLQAERLQARALALRDSSAAQTWLVRQLDAVMLRNFGLEATRTRAALARVTIEHAPGSAAGLALFAQAQRELSSYGALAEAEALRQLELLSAR
jgi:DNA-binding SARP family transcriptional activator